MIDERSPDTVPMTEIGATRPDRSITRRGGLPTGRAVVGALLVTASVVGLFVAYRESQQGPDTSYVVMAREVRAGERIEADDVTLRAMQLSDDVARLATTDLDAAIGSVAIETQLPGQLVQPQAILAPATGEPSQDTSHELSFSISRSRALAGTLQPGELVDVVATVADTGATCTAVVVSNARVVRVGGAGGDDLLTGGSGDLTITLAVAQPDDVLSAVFAIDEADVTIIRSTRAERGALSGQFCNGDLAT